MLNFTEEIRKQSPFINLLGLSIVKLEHGHCQSLLEIKDSFLNKHKFVHGGIIYSLADISMGVTVYSVINKDEETSTIEIKINYLKPVIERILTCDAHMIQKVKNVAVLEAEIKADDILVAKALGTFYIFKSKRGNDLGNTES